MDSKAIRDNGLLERFRAYLSPSDDEYTAALKSGLLVVDTNVLLNVYRYHEDAREDLLRTLEAFHDRLFIPHQVAVEFWRNRDATIREASSAADQLKNELSGLADRSRQSLSRWAKRAGLADSRVQELHTILDAAHDRVIVHVEEFSDGGLDSAIDTNRDPVLARLVAITNECVGAPFHEDEVEQHSREAQRRIDERLPPGYEDADKSGLAPHGDYMLWRQILDVAIARPMDIVLVTGDVKEDWWRREKGQIRGPRIELFEELNRESGHRLFMLRPASLLERAKGALNLDIRQDSVEVAERIDRNSFDRERQRYYAAPALYPVVKLPDGRKGDYLETLIQMTEIARDEPGYEQFVESFQEAFPSITLASEARRRIGILASLGLVSFSEDRVRLTETGERLLEERTLEILQDQFMSRIAGASEVRSKALSLPRDELRRQLREESSNGLSPTQAALILRWMEQLKLV
ncbi:hypothetical protein E4J89_11135 [Arthrobacter sp. CAU 1506]|uniref:PIN-like domain-containing protein n=1 Tax=Arthrobacter sp. CAU 1506 TaxID=2560052 RepID=UPI0010ABDA70|nr:PIN domain-containing protein [Arthrobacter sp. CAU 1506]TJY69467.1 hypothetical protein E4J89_11135 [Arthrobacter sp. CAU 1506]